MKDMKDMKKDYKWPRFLKITKGKVSLIMEFNEKMNKNKRELDKRELDKRELDEKAAADAAELISKYGNCASYIILGKVPKQISQILDGDTNNGDSLWVYDKEISLGLVSLTAIADVLKMKIEVLWKLTIPSDTEVVLAKVK